MPDIYFHLHTPVNIEETKKYFVSPIIFSGTIYCIKEKILQDILSRIGYLQDYIKFKREHEDDNIYSWLSKKNLLNEGFLEAVSQYWIDDVAFNKVSNYIPFQKNDTDNPIIPEYYLRELFQKVILYGHIKEKKDNLNEYIEKELDVIEKELSSIKDKKSLTIRRSHYQNNFFEMILDNFITNNKIDISEKTQDINNINVMPEKLLNWDDLCVYKTCNVNGYNNFKIKLTGISYRECLRKNTFIKLYTSFGSSYSDESYLRDILEEVRTYSHALTLDRLEFGSDYIKKMIGYEEETKTSNCQKQIETVKSCRKETGSSNVVLLQKTQSFVSETESHMIARYNALKNYSNMYLAPADEMTTLISVLNMDKDNLKRMNNLIWDKPGKIETELMKFTFKNGNLPYSSYGFASLNF
jgi:hypothetical protein